MLMAAFAFPNRQRRAPVTVTGQAPILYMFEPVAKTAFTDGFRNPVDLVVVGNQLILLSVEGELGISDAVAIPSDEGSEVASFVAQLDVVVDVVEPQHHIT